MTKKKERVFNSVEEELAYLKKQLAGMKGRNSSLAKVCAEHEKYIHDLESMLDEERAESARLRNLLDSADKPKKCPWWRFW